MSHKGCSDDKFFEELKELSLTLCSIVAPFRMAWPGVLAFPHHRTLWKNRALSLRSVMRFVHQVCWNLSGEPISRLIDCYRFLAEFSKSLSLAFHEHFTGNLKEVLGKWAPDIFRGQVVTSAAMVHVYTSAKNIKYFTSNIPTLLLVKRKERE